MGAVYVVGSGGIALFLQSLLQEPTGSHLVLRARSLERLQGATLHVTGAREGTLPLVTKAWEALPPLGPADTVFLATGANDATAALKRLAQLIDPQTTVVLCQNAIGMQARARELLPACRLLRMHCWLGSSKRAPDHIHILGIFKLDLSSAPDDAALLARWRQTFESCAIPTTTDTDVPLAEWTKALWTIALHGICAIADAPIGIVHESQGMESLARALMEEARDVAALDGIALAQDDIDDVIEWVAAAPMLRNATLRDLESGRPHDLAHFNGAVRAAAARHGQRAPYNEMVLALVDEIQATGLRRAHHRRKRLPP